VYSHVLAELSKGEADHDEARRLLGLLLEALHLWNDCYTERMERELGSLLLAHVSDVHFVRELVAVLQYRASPVSERILLETTRRAHEQGHAASLVEIVSVLVNWIGQRDDFLDAWVERAIVVGVEGIDVEATALIASRYLRDRPSRAPWLGALIRENPTVTYALCADAALLFLAPTVEGMLDWSARGDWVDEDRLSAHAPWLDSSAFDHALRLAYDRADEEQRLALDTWRAWITNAESSAGAPRAVRDK
jgi:hypothetical protein